ncbi:thioredoxin [Candidatus Nomurabacteria bacterium]|uniref:Thioredoxin n=1 Tax=candidate division WWE3 bacterium TaxID=2053526 RepID=A0A955IXA2_UNCKA|nr:thioredoxin [candidate division WWE3 bacterium]MCB9823439.1 thioredoxin [Candidatus Nomurabacteria bacterium]MCB9827721.1 thioredoxin [Candidatus Nomurabacteria bacterium]HXK52667.1 thioredoxin [bacterium]
MIKIVDFYADWCGPCQMMKPVFHELEKEYEGKIEFKQVDVEADNATAAKFGVMSIPTFVILKDEKEIDRRMGAMPKEMMKKWLDSHLE